MLDQLDVYHMCTWQKLYNCSSQVNISIRIFVASAEFKDFFEYDLDNKGEDSIGEFNQDISILPSEKLVSYHLKKCFMFEYYITISFKFYNYYRLETILCTSRYVILRLKKWQELLFLHLAHTFLFFDIKPFDASVEVGTDVTCLHIFISFTDHGSFIWKH